LIFLFLSVDVEIRLMWRLLVSIARPIVRDAATVAALMLQPTK
jgi:hypothetical protein